MIYGSSTKRDVILLSADGFNSGLELAVKSLRSTGSQCRVVILALPEFRIPPRVQFIFTELEIEIEILAPDRSNRLYVPHLLRYEYEYQWLTTHSKEVDRVFHADAFDIYFQKDPFDNDIKTDSLLFALEPQYIRSCGWNLGWLSSCYNNSLADNIRHHFIICSGSIIGGVTPYLVLLRLMINSHEWSKCWSSSMDQPIVNYLVWTGELARAGVSYTFTGCNGNFFTMQWCIFDKVVLQDANDFIVSISQTVPAFVHQYNRNVTLIAHLYKKCQIQPYPIFAHLR